MTTPIVTTHERPDEAREPAEVPGRFRFWLITILSIIMLMPMIDRVAISLLLADPGFLSAVGIAGDPVRQGLLVSAYVFPYAIFNVVLGPALDRFGGRGVIGTMVAGWLAFTLLLSAVRGFVPAALLRGLRGIWDAPLYPLMSWFVKFWIPARERGIANAIWLAAGPFGHTIGVPIVAVLLAAGGYQLVLIALALVTGLVGGPLVWWFVSDRPAQSRWVKPAEREWIAADQEAEQDASASFLTSARGFATNYRFWLLVIHHVAFMGVYWGLLAWLPNYLIDLRGLSTQQMGFYYTMFFLGPTVAIIVAGIWSDRSRRRAPLMVVGMTGGMATILFATVVGDAVLAAWSFVLSASIMNLQNPNYYALMQRIIPSRVMGAGSGLDNGITNLLGATTPAIIGYLIAASGGYDAGLVLLAALSGVGAVMMGVLMFEGY